MKQLLAEKPITKKPSLVKIPLTFNAGPSEGWHYCGVVKLLAQWLTGCGYSNIVAKRILYWLVIQ